MELAYSRRAGRYSGILLGLALFLGALLHSFEARAAPLNTWGGHIPESKLGLLLYQNYSLTNRTAHSQLWFITGVSDKFDFGVAQAATYGSISPLPTTELMLRYFPAEGLAVVARASATIDQSFSIGPEIHFQRKWSWFQFTTNVIFRPPINPDYPIPFKAIVAPEFFVHDRISFYAEVDASYDFRNHTGDIALVPGISLLLGKDNRHLISAAAQVGVYAPPTVTVPSVLVGAWYMVVLDG